MTAAQVLVVDDERFFREAMSEALQGAGLACSAAATGEEALKRAQDPEIGVAVLDLRLGDMEGLDVLRALRRERPELRVIALSAANDQELVLEALRLEACDYLAKPLHDEELVLSVRRALVQHALELRLAGLRERLAALRDAAGGLAAQAGSAAADPLGTGLGQAGAEAAARLLGAAKTSVLWVEAGAGVLRVAGQTGRSLSRDDFPPVRLGEAVAGRVAESGEALRVDDTRSDPRLAGRDASRPYDTQAFLAVPIGAAPVRGVLCATDRTAPGPFAEEDQLLLQLLGQQLAALCRAGGAPAAPEPEAPAAGPGVPASAADSDAELAREICDAITAEIEPSRIFEAALRPVARALPAAPVALYLLDPATQELVQEAQVPGESRGDAPRLSRERGLTASVLQTGQLVATDHPETDPRFDPATDTPVGHAVGPLLCVPLRLRGKVLGVARAFPRGGASASSRSGEVLSAALSAAVRNVLLYRSLLESIDEVARVRQERSADGPRGGPRDGLRGG